MANSSITNVPNRQQITINGVHSLFEPFLRFIMQNKFGIFLEAIELRDVSSSCDDGKGDRFRIAIPYANQKLEWLVMFNAFAPKDAPDFEFSDKSFLADPDLDIMERFIPSWFNWDFENPGSLLMVLTELVMHYKTHQLCLMGKLSEQLSTEFSKLVNRIDIEPEDVEVILTPDSIQPTEAHFLIRLTADFSKLPAKYTVVNDTAAILHATFRGPHWSRSNVDLYLSENLKEVFTNSNSIHLPPCSQNMSLMDYVPEVKQIINNKIKSIIMTYEKKSAFINAAWLLQSNSIVEYDSIDFNYVVLLLEHCDFHFLVQFNLSPDFPKEPPRVTLLSVYFMSSKHDVYKYVIPSEVIPYSPRWEPVKMFTKAITHIIDSEVNKFKNNSTKNRRC